MASIDLKDVPYTQRPSKYLKFQLLDFIMLNFINLEKRQQMNFSGG